MMSGTGIYEGLMGSWIEAGRPAGEEWAALWGRAVWHLEEQVYRMLANGASDGMVRGIRDRLRDAKRIADSM